MRKAIILSLSIMLLLSIMLSSPASGVGPLALPPTALAFLPYIAQEVTPTPTLQPTPVRTLEPTPTPGQEVTPTPTLGPTPTPGVEPPSPPEIVELTGATEPEYVDILSLSSAPQDMTGWYLVSVIGQETFSFPAGYILNPGALVQIESYNGATSNPPLQLFWTGDAVWNNSGDKAILYNSSGAAVSSACYGIGCAP